MEISCEDLGKGPEFPRGAAPQNVNQQTQERPPQQRVSQSEEFLKDLQPPKLILENPGLTAPILSEDDPERFLVSFEKVAEACQWPREEWAARLVPALGGEAARAFRKLAAGDREDYGKVKAAILQGDAIKMEVQRQCFRQFRFQEVEDPQRAYGQLRELCRQWLKPEKHTKEQILDLVVLEQFLAILPQETQKRMEKCSPKACAQAVALAEDLLRNHQEAKMWRLEEPLQKMTQSFLRAEEMAAHSTEREICKEAKQQGDGGATLLSSRTPSPSVSAPLHCPGGSELAEGVLDEFQGTVDLKGATVLSDTTEKAVLNPIQTPVYWKVLVEEDETVAFSGGPVVLPSLVGQEKLVFVPNSEHKDTFPGRSMNRKETENSQQGSPERQGPSVIRSGEPQDTVPLSPGVSLSPGVMWPQMSDQGMKQGVPTLHGMIQEFAEGIADPPQEKKLRRGSRTCSSNIAQHRQERLYQCFECEKTFCGIHALAGHQRIHKTKMEPRGKKQLLARASLTKGNEGLSKFRVETPQQERNERESISNGRIAEFPQSKMTSEPEWEPEGQQGKKTVKTQKEPIKLLEGRKPQKETVAHMWVKKLSYSSQPGNVCPSTPGFVIQETPPTEKAPYQCPSCGKSLMNKVRLEDHHRVHIGDALWMPTVWGKVSLEKLCVQTFVDP
uniref:zinc finger protein 213-like n=1 Tax=Podarcis muralis TaxID=64176 RepID=UPI0010A03D96|nr:zinc finger protein 213-like [Podarcis muralis]